LKNLYFLSQPHQPFFLLAFINAIITMVIFMLSFKGVLSIELSSKDYHAYSMIFMLFTPAFMAFLFTTFPRFSTTPPIKQSLYVNVFWLFLASSFLMIIGIFTSNETVLVAMAINILAHTKSLKILVDIYKSSPVEAKSDQFWILVAISFGLISHILFISGLSINILNTFAIDMAIYLYLFLVTFTVAQRMVPFFSNIFINKNPIFFKAMVGLLVAKIILEAIKPNSSFFIDFLLFALIGLELFKWKLPFPNPNPFIWILHIGLYWIPVAFLFGGVSNLLTLMNDTYFLYLDIHTLALGFFFTMLIGFGTRVTIGHSGNQMIADNFTIALFYWTQVVIFMRIFTSLIYANGLNFLVAFDISITVWLLMFVAWGVRFFAVLVIGKRL